jgi:AcrR family transcriptional regulator
MPDATSKSTPKRARPKPTPTTAPLTTGGEDVADWHRRVVDRSLRSATKKSIDRGAAFIRAASILLERSNGDGFTVQEVADESGQSLRTLYQYFESKDDLILAVFEEAMKAYADAIRAAIVDLDDPVERLAGAVMAAATIPERRRTGVDIGLTRLRKKLGQVEPDLVARSQEPVISLLKDLVGQAAASGQVADFGDEQAVYMVAALNTAFIISDTLGNEYGLALPDARDLARFCLQGLGADLGTDWYATIDDRLHLPAARPKARKPSGNGKAASGTR